MTALELYAEIVEDLGVPENDAIYRDRVAIANRSVNVVAGRVFNIISNHYYTTATKSVTSSKVDISDLNVIGNDITVAGYMPVTMTRYQTLSGTCFSDRLYYIHTRVGNEILLSPTALTVTLYYYRTPTQVAGENDNIDLPLGIATELAIMQGKKIVSERLGMDYRLTEEMVRGKINDLMTQYGVTLKKQELDQAVQSLL